MKAPHHPINSTYLHYAIPGTVLMAFFAVVIPATYFLILWFLRHRLEVRYHTIVILYSDTYTSMTSMVELALLCQKAVVGRSARKSLHYLYSCMLHMTIRTILTI